MRSIEIEKLNNLHLVQKIFVSSPWHHDRIPL